MVQLRRDPLSVHYDGYVRVIMIRAIRASRDGKGVRVWIASPRREYSRPDPKGLTRHERAFSRSSYYLIYRVPMNEYLKGGDPPAWSLKLTWTDEIRPSSGGRMARGANIRIFERGRARVRRGRSYVGDPSLRSMPTEDGSGRVIPALVAQGAETTARGLPPVTETGGRSRAELEKPTPDFRRMACATAPGPDITGLTL